MPPDQTVDREDTEAAAALGAAVIRMMAAAGGESGAVTGEQATASLIVDEGARLIPGVETALSVVDGDGAIHLVAATGPLSKSLNGDSGPLETTAVGRCLTRLETVVEPASASKGTPFGAVLEEAGARVLRASPLLTRGALQRRALGAYVFVRFDGCEFSPEETKLLDAFTLLVSLSLVRMAQHQELERASRRWALGVDVALDLGGAVNSDDVYRRILTRALDALDAQRATLLRFDGGRLFVEAVQDVSARGAPIGHSIDIDTQPALAEALRSRRPVADGRIISERLPQPSRDALKDVHFVAVLPLVLLGEVIGFLNVHRRTERAFDDDDIETLQVLGNVAAVTLRNARLLADTQTAKHTMSEFLHVIVHEMRAPLTIIGGYIGMMQEGIFGETPPSLSLPMETIDSKIREAQRLVDELLMVARLEEGPMPHREEPVDLGDAVRRAVRRAQPRAELLKATLETKTTEGVTACADRGHVDRILDNLINNALAHGGDPPRAVVSVHDGERPSVSVSDNGEGVPPSERDHIFDRFYRGTTTKASGTGLGLFISRRLAETSGGSLTLDEHEDRPGARFLLRLPPVHPHEGA